MAYLADDLCTDVRRGGSIPAAASTGTADTDILAHGDAEIRDTLVPLLLGVREEFYQRVFDVTVEAGVAAYRINKRAALSHINTVQWINTDSTGFNLPRYEPKQVADLCLLTTAVGQPIGYYLEGSRVVLYPTPGGSGTLRIRAQVRPSRMKSALATEAQATTAITSSTVGSTPCWRMTFSALFLSAVPPFDVVSSTPSFEHLVLDTNCLASAATYLDIAKSAFSSPPVVGDWVTLSDLSPQIQLPVELQPALTELVVARMLRALGKLSEAQAHAEEAQRLVAIGIQALTPRVDSADRKILGGPHFRKRGIWGVW